MLPDSYYASLRCRFAGNKKEMRYILRTCAGREEYAEYVQRLIPSVQICFDKGAGAMGNFLQSLEMSGDEAVVNLEDDIWITQGFEKKAEKAISKKPEILIQFFSMRKLDKTIGSRYDAGRSYLMGQCTYFPARMSKGILAFSKKYDRIDHKSHPLDSMIAEYLSKTKQKYWIHCPNLVDHKIGKSMIDPRRASTNRQSFTFCDREE
tara:strand:+ start:1853 stop:2473 length:621 start_codon:yes stop_codon:yes gene_type:complete